MVVYYYYYYYLEAQVNTQNYGKRPYGVGLLVVGHDVNIIIMLICLTKFDYFECCN